jgi:hypothetical protein
MGPSLTLFRTLIIAIYMHALSLKPCMHLKFQTISFDSQSLSAFHAETIL